MWKLRLREAEYLAEVPPPASGRAGGGVQGPHLPAGRPRAAPGTHQAHPLPCFPAQPKDPSPSPPGPQSRPRSARSCSTLLVPVRGQAKCLLFEEGSLELGCSRRLDIPTLPGDVRGGWRRTPGRQAETVAVGERTTHTITRGPPRCPRQHPEAHGRRASTTRGSSTALRPPPSVPLKAMAEASASWVPRHGTRQGCPGPRPPQRDGRAGGVALLCTQRLHCFPICLPRHVLPSEASGGSWYQGASSTCSGASPGH